MFLPFCRFSIQFHLNTISPSISQTHLLNRKSMKSCNLLVTLQQVWLASLCTMTMFELKAKETYTYITYSLFPVYLVCGYMCCLCLLTAWWPCPTRRSCTQEPWGRPERWLWWWSRSHWAWYSALSPPAEKARLFKRHRKHVIFISVILSNSYPNSQHWVLAEARSLGPCWRLQTDNNGGWFVWTASTSERWPAGETDIWTSALILISWTCVYKHTSVCL